MLKTSQESTHTTSSHLTKKKETPCGLERENTNSLGRSKYDCWAQLDVIVSSKLINCNLLTERLDLQQNVVYSEAANIFGHSQLAKRNLTRQSRRTKLTIQLIKEKNMLMAHINTIFLLDQQIVLERLLNDVKSNICSLCKSEKS